MPITREESGSFSRKSEVFHQHSLETKYKLTDSFADNADKADNISITLS